MASIQRKLAAIFAADVHQFSRMMGEDEAGTLAGLRHCRQIVDGLIAGHHGRIFGSAGDSVVAEFASVVSAVQCAVDCQRALAARNGRGDGRSLLFRIGVNVGDVIVEGDNLYGDGVNIAARLEAAAKPGSVCVSAKVYDEVRRKLADIVFVDGGKQTLKNIEDPVGIYHVDLGGEAVVATAAPVPAATEKTSIAVSAIRVISGNDEVKALAAGLTDAIAGALARNTALAVTSGDQAGAEFLLQGSVQGAGKRLRFSFGLEESASATRVWSNRYDRELSDVFDLQDEIVLHVAANIRIGVKAQLFDRLRGTDNAALMVPQLLDKAVGIFIHALDRDGEGVSTLRLAVERAPENAMAWAMLAFALFRIADYDARAMSPAARDELMATVDRALALDPHNYSARSTKALALFDLLGDPRSARVHVNEALQRNANFLPAQALLGIIDIHLGDLDAGLRRLRGAMAASPEDTSQHRHRRELAIAHLLAGDVAEGVRVATSLWQEKPDMKRNALVLAGLLAAAGDKDGAARQVAAAKAATPGLDLQSARLPSFGDAAAGQRFRALLKEAGL